MWEVEVNYGQGWEYEIGFDTAREALESLVEYTDNCPFPSRIVKKRERIEEVSYV